MCSDIASVICTYSVNEAKARCLGLVRRRYFHIRIIVTVMTFHTKVACATSFRNGTKYLETGLQRILELWADFDVRLPFSCLRCAIDFRSGWKQFVSPNDVPSCVGISNASSASNISWAERWVQEFATPGHRYVNLHKASVPFQ